MKGNKGQISVFITIGIVLVLTSAIFFFITTIKKSEIPLTAPSSEEQLFIENCLKAKLKSVVDSASLSGGLVNPPEDSYRTSTYIAPYYFDGIEKIPDLIEIESQLASEADVLLDDCIEELNQQEVFSAERRISQGVKINVYDERIDATVEDVIIIKSRDKIQTIPGLKITYQVPFGTFYLVAKNIAKEFGENKGKISLEQLRQKNENIDIFLGKEKTTIVSINVPRNLDMYEFVMVVRA